LTKQHFSSEFLCFPPANQPQNNVLRLANLGPVCRDRFTDLGLCRFPPLSPCPPERSQWRPGLMGVRPRVPLSICPFLRPTFLLCFDFSFSQFWSFSPSLFIFQLTFDRFLVPPPADQFGLLSSLGGFPGSCLLFSVPIRC